jgi:hypothetical protein
MEIVMRRSVLFAVLTVPVLIAAPAFAATTAPAQPAAAAPMVKPHHAAHSMHHRHVARTANSEQDQTRKLNEEQLGKK